MTNDQAHDRYREAAQILHDVAKPMRVLSALAWPAELREEFLAGGADKLPEPTYAGVDPTSVLDGISAARRLAATGQRRRRLARPGSHRDRVDGADAVVGRARPPSTPTAASSTASPTNRCATTRPPRSSSRGRSTTRSPTSKQHRWCPRSSADRTGEEVAAFIEEAVTEHFGDAAPEVLFVDELSANAVASTSRIKIRRDAMFTPKDAAQLLNHEAFIHVATGLNGRAQTDIPILAIGHPGTTRTQEGLAVYSEYVSGTLGIDRLRRLADRIVATQLVIDGADFIELYRWFLERSPNPEQAFESTRRIFRGAPITRRRAVHQGLRLPVRLPVGGHLHPRAFRRGSSRHARRCCSPASSICSRSRRSASCAARAWSSRARFVPPWATDPGWVLAHLTLNTFMADIDLSAVTDAMSDVLAHCPSVEIDPAA